MNNRISRINSEIQKTLRNSISYNLKDPRLENSFVSVLDVEVSNDLSYAKIKISVFPEENKEKVFNVLKNSIPFLRKEIAKNVKIRIVPELLFSLDEGYNYENKINEILKEIKSDGTKD